MNAKIKISPEVMDVLKRASIKDNSVILPPERLDLKFYQQVAKVLKALGGKWVGGKTQAHEKSHLHGTQLVLPLLLAADRPGLN